jgi:hypothetical protein
MAQIRAEPLVANNMLITRTPEQGRALAIMLAGHSVPAVQKELEVLKSGRVQHARDPNGLIAASYVVAVEFATIAAANNDWRWVQRRSRSHRRKRTPGPCGPGVLAMIGC